MKWHHQIKNSTTENIAQNERYVSDIFANEEKNLDNKAKCVVSYPFRVGK